MWAIDFLYDQTMDGLTLKFLNMINEFSRASLAIRAGRRCQSLDVIDTIGELLKVYPPPTHLRIKMALSSLPTPCRSGAQVAAR